MNSDGGHANQELLAARPGRLLNPSVQRKPDEDSRGAGGQDAEGEEIKHREVGEPEIHQGELRLERHPLAEVEDGAEGEASDHEDDAAESRAAGP